MLQQIIRLLGADAAQHAAPGQPAAQQTAGQWRPQTEYVWNSAGLTGIITAMISIGKLDVGPEAIAISAGEGENARDQHLMLQCNIIGRARFDDFVRSNFLRRFTRFCASQHGSWHLP